MEDPNAPGADLAALMAPAVGFRRLLVVGTGALSVTHLPFWLNWIDGCYPELEVRIAVTPSATRFVSMDALTALSAHPVRLDSWDATPVRPAPHIEFAQWPDAVLVHPAGVNFIARLALGMADTPVQLALQLTEAVIGVAPALPPGHENSASLRRHLATLSADLRVVVGATEEAVSASTREVHNGAAAPMSSMFALMEQRRRQLTNSTEAGGHVDNG